MKDEEKTKVELIKELKALRKVREEGSANDITERKQIEKALKESEKKWRSLVNILPDYISLLDLEGRFLFLNHYAEGFTEKEVIGTSTYQYFSPESKEIFKKEMAECQNTKKMRKFEHTAMGDHGIMKKYEDYLAPLLEDNQVTSFMVISRNITERKQMEEENSSLLRIVQEERDKLSRLIDSISDEIWFTDTHKKFTLANPSALSEFKLSSSDLTDVEAFARSLEVYRPDMSPRPVKEAPPLRALRGEVVKNQEEIVKVPASGQLRYRQVNATPVKDANGNIIGAVSVVRDITESKQSEERIKHLDLVIHAIRHVNQLIVTEKDRERLLKGICDSLIKTRGYYHSRIVLLDEEGKIDSYTEAGLRKDFLPLLKLLKKDEMTPCGQTATKQKGLVIIKDPASACPDCLLVSACSDLGSIMTIRLENNGKIYGVISVSIPDYSVIDKEEHDLFEEVAGDIALGLSSIEMVEKLDKKTQDLKERVKELKRAMDATINTMSNIIEVKDPFTSGHQQRVSQLTTAIAKELNLSQDKIEGIRTASLIHDIGKIGLPTEIMSKPSELSDIEFSLIKEHSQMGHDILKPIDFSYPVADIILQHHEKLNGSGYPQRLKGEEILLEAKIICVADVVEAMSSHRPYRPALGIEKALEEITQNRGILYDPEVVDACLKLFKEKGFNFE